MTYFTQEQAVEMALQLGADERDSPWVTLDPKELTALVNLAAERAVEAATKHQDALIAAAYLDAAQTAQIIFDNEGEIDDERKFVYALTQLQPDQAKAALRELCLQSIRVFEAEYDSSNPVSLEAIVDKVLAG